MDLLTPSSPGGLPTLSLTTNSSWLPWGRVAMPLISPLMPVPKLSEICGLQTKILVNPRHIHKPTQLHISSMERNINTRSLQSRSNHLHMLEVKEIRQSTAWRRLGGIVLKMTSLGLSQKDVPLKNKCRRIHGGNRLTQDYLEEWPLIWSMRGEKYWENSTYKDLKSCRLRHHHRPCSACQELPWCGCWCPSGPDRSPTRSWSVPDECYPASCEPSTTVSVANGHHTQTKIHTCQHLHNIHGNSAVEASKP